MADPIEELKKQLGAAKGDEVDLSSPQAVLVHFVKSLWSLVYDGKLDETYAKNLMTSFGTFITSVTQSGQSLEKQMEMVRARPQYQWLAPGQHEKTFEYNVRKEAQAYKQYLEQEQAQRQAEIEWKRVNAQLMLDQQRESALQEALFQQRAELARAGLPPSEAAQNFEKRKQQIAASYQGGYSDTSQEVLRFLETANISPAARSYWESNLGDIARPLEVARKLWWDTVHQARLDYELRQWGRRPTEYAPGYAPQLGSDLDREAAQLSGMPVDTTPIGGGGGGSEAGEEQTAEAQAAVFSPKLGQDPLQGYLATFPFQEKFLQRSPRQRGFYPGTISPITRWR